MKKNTLVKVLSLLVLVTGMVTAGANTAGAGETVLNDWDSFVKKIDPSSSTGADKEPLCQRVAEPNTASGRGASISDWDAFLLSVDPGSSVNIGNVMLCTGTVNKEVAQKSGNDWDAFMKIMNPRSSS